MSKDNIQVLVLSGSLNLPSHTRANIDYISELLREHGAAVRIWDPRENPLPLHNPIYHRDPKSNKSEAVRLLAQEAENADAFIWGTPVYHNSFSGVLKNALDNLSYRYFRHKPIGLICNGGARSGVQPCDQLRIVARGLHAVAIPTQVVTIGSDFELFNDHYEIVNTDIQGRFARLAKELIDYSKALSLLRV